MRPIFPKNSSPGLATCLPADPARLDQLADFHLRLGYTGTAERLAHLAAEIRAGAQP